MRRSGTSHMSATITYMQSAIHWLRNDRPIARDIKHQGKLTFKVAPNRHSKHGFVAVRGHDGLLQPMVTKHCHREDDAIWDWSRACRGREAM
jgi:hypothetical protein